MRYNRITEAMTFKLILRYIDNVLSIKKQNFANWIPLIYPKEHETIEAKINSTSSSQFLEMCLKLSPMVDFPLSSMINKIKRLQLCRYEFSTP
jgi:hypothetical protein